MSNEQKCDLVAKITKQIKTQKLSQIFLFSDFENTKKLQLTLLINKKTLTLHYIYCTHTTTNYNVI